MPDEQDSTSDPEGDDLSQLELPKLFRRRKARPEPEEEAVDAGEPPAEHEAPEAPEAPEPTREIAAESPRRQRFSLRRSRQDPASVAPATDQEPETETPAPVKEPERETKTPTTVVEPERETKTPTTVVEPEAPTDVAEPERAPEPEEERAPEPEPAPEAPSSAAEPTTWQPSGQVDSEPVEDVSPAATVVDEPAAPTGTSRLQRVADLRLPPLAGHWAAAITGAVSGLAGVLLVVAAQALSQAVRGTSNAGAAGVFLVVGIIAVCVVLGAAGLRAWGQTETLSTSFLGTGLVVVVVMLFLLPVIFSWVVVVVIPVLGALAFALSWWVSHRLGPEARKVNDEYSPEVHR